MQCEINNLHYYVIELHAFVKKTNKQKQVTYLQIYQLINGYIYHTFTVVAIFLEQIMHLIKS